MKSNLLAVVLVVLVNSPAWAQRHGKEGKEGGRESHRESHRESYREDRRESFHHHEARGAGMYDHAKSQPYSPPASHFDSRRDRDRYDDDRESRRDNCNGTRTQCFINFAMAPRIPMNVVPRCVSPPRPRATPEQLAAISHAAAPKPLTDDQYNRATGELVWPEALQSSDFAAYRAELAQIFSQRTAYSDHDWKTKSDEVRRLTSQLRDQLSAQVKDLKPMNFVNAKKFLDGLSRETTAAT